VDFSGLVKQSRFASAPDFLQVLEDATDVLSGAGALVKLEPTGTAIVVGDLHGDLTSLNTIIQQSGFLTLMANHEPVRLIFLGDYVDRGEQSPAVYFTVLSLKLAFVEQVVLLRGNHEGPADLKAQPHDLPLFLQHRFKEHWSKVYEKMCQSFNCLSIAAYVNGRYLMVHGGLPEVCSLQDLAQAPNLHPNQPFLEQLLWNDPDEQVHGNVASPRGAGNLFGKDTTNTVLTRLNAKILIRGHEATPDGYKFNHDGKVLTLFSRKGAPYFNRYGAYLQVPLNKPFENGCQLLPFIHTF
jgi:protein phosphatase